MCEMTFAEMVPLSPSWRDVRANVGCGFQCVKRGLTCHTAVEQPTRGTFDRRSGRSIASSSPSRLAKGKDWKSDLKLYE